MKVIASRNATYAEVRRILEGLSERGVELESIEIRVLDYIRKFTRCRRGDELVEELSKMGLSEITAVMIANIVPRDLDTLRILLTFESKTFENEFLNNVLNTVNAYCTE
ncbi:MAG: hypothetical protein QXP80_03830 [Zestosphaera sp.]